MKVVKSLGMDNPRPMDATVPVPLSVERQAEKGMDLAQLVAERDALVDQKKAHAKADQELIDQVDERISSIAKQIREGMEDKLQRDLKFEDTQALARVAEHVGEVPVKPSDPHKFEGKAKECGLCGSGRKDPIHGEDAFAFRGDEPRDPIIQSHAAIDLPPVPAGEASGPVMGSRKGPGNGAAAKSELLDGAPADEVGDPKRTVKLVDKKAKAGKRARS